jgi:cell division protein FtsI (penicillin-binding protein 3)
MLSQNRCEPGSTFKLVDLMAILEDKVLTLVLCTTHGGCGKYYGRSVKGFAAGGYGKISLARGFELSSNTVMVQAIR